MKQFHLHGLDLDFELPKDVYGSWPAKTEASWNVGEPWAMGTGILQGVCMPFCLL